MDALGLERDRVAADRDASAAQARGLLVDMTRLTTEADGRDSAVSVLGLAVGLLREGVAPDDPRIREVEGRSRELGVGRRVPVRTGPLGYRSAPDRAVLVGAEGRRTAQIITWPGARRSTVPTDQRVEGT